MRDATPKVKPQSHAWRKGAAVTTMEQENKMKTFAFGLLLAGGIACNDSPAKRFEDQQKNMPAPNLDVSKQPTVDLTRNEAADTMVARMRDYYGAKAPDSALRFAALTSTAKAIDGLQHPASSDARAAVSGALTKLKENATAGEVRDLLDADLKALKTAQVPLANELIGAAEKEVEAIDRTKSADAQTLALRHATCSVASAIAVASAIDALQCAVTP